MANESLRLYFASIAAFVLAKFKQSNNLYQVASDVRCWYQGEFITVGELLTRCINHNWNTTIYESWVYESAGRVRSAASYLAGLELEAFLHVASDILSEADCNLAELALHEAKQQLEECYL